MLRSWLASLTAGSLAVLIVTLSFGTPATARAADEDQEEVRFTTHDNVELVGTWYKGKQGKNSPVALLLHATGPDNNRNKGDWDKLAKTLQKRGFAVLTFDFRGHGDSTLVTPSFWKFPTNANYIPEAKGKTAISVKQFKSGYYPMLANDIAAARYFIDQKNDAMDCNSSNILVIGAEDGAALGLLWVASEWRRNISPPNQPFMPPNPFRPAGPDITAAIWLSYNNPKKDMLTSEMPYTKWTAPLPAIKTDYPLPLRNSFDQLFLFGGKDDKTQASATWVFDKVLEAGRDEAKPPYQKLKQTFKKDVGDSGGVGGIGLVGKSGLQTDELINRYIDITIDKRTPVWKKKEPPAQVAPIMLRDFGFTIP